MAERDEIIKAFHVKPDPAGLKCPLCGTWQALSFDSPQGVKMFCRDCGVIVIMPRVPLVRAITRRR